jgi:hypothetical protein
MYIGDMIVSEKIIQKVAKLPISIQLEVLDFVEFLAQKAERQTAHEETAQWSEFSLNQAMRGLEDEDSPEYTEADLKEKWR